MRSVKGKNGPKRESVNRKNRQKSRGAIEGGGDGGECRHKVGKFQKDGTTMELANQKSKGGLAMERKTWQSKPAIRPKQVGF